MLLGVSFKGVTTYRIQISKIVAVSLMVSLLLVTSTVSDGLVYQAFASDPSNATFIAGVLPSNKNLFFSQELLLTELQQTGQTDNTEVIYVDLLEDMNYTAPANLSKNFLIIGLSSIESKVELKDTIIGIEIKTAQLFGLKVGDKFSLQSENESLIFTVGTVFDLTDWIEKQVINALAVWPHPPSYFPFFTTIAKARNISELFPYVTRNTNVADWLTVSLNISIGNEIKSYSQLRMELESSVVQIYSALSNYGTVEIEHTPLNRIDRLYGDYSMIEQDIAIIVFPTIVISVVFLSFIFRVNAQRQKRRFAILFSRGMSLSQLRFLNFQSDILAGIIGGVLSIPIALALSSPFLPAITRILIGSLINPAELLSLLLSEIVIGILLIVLPSLLFSGAFKKVSTPAQLATSEETGRYKSNWKLMTILFVISLIMFYEMISNFSFVQWLILNAENSPSFITVAKMLMLTEIVVAILTPVFLVVAIARFAPWWHTKLWTLLARFIRITGDGSSLIAKALSLKPQRSYYLAVLFLSSVFLATFIGTYHSTQFQTAAINTQLQVGGDLRVRLSDAGPQVVADLLQFLAVQPGVKTISNCSAAYAELLDANGYYNGGMLYIVDDTYFTLSALTALNHEQKLSNKTTHGIIVAASFAEAFDSITTLHSLKDENVNVTISGSIAFAPGFHEEMTDFQTSYLRMLTSYVYLTSLGFSIESSETYIFVETATDVTQLESAVLQWLQSVSSMGNPIDYSVKARTSVSQSSQIQSAFIDTCSSYLVIAGLAAVVMNVLITLDERRFQLRVINARGATSRQIVAGLSMYYLTMAIPMVVLGIVLSILYTYAAVFAPIMLTHEVFSGARLEFPTGYTVVIPLSVVAASIGIVIASIVANFLLVRKYLEKKRAKMEED